MAGYEFKKSVDEGSKFPGVIVRSEVREFDTNSAWQVWIYNRNTGNFLRDSSTIVDEDSTAYPRSTIRRMRKAYAVAGVEVRHTDDVHGLEFEFDTEIKDITIRGDSVTSVHYKPVRRIGAASEVELAELNGRLDAQLTKRTAAAPTASTPTTAFDADTVEKLVALYDGHTEDEAKAKAYKAKDLETDVVNAVAVGTAATTLVGMGALGFNAETERYEKVA